MLPACSRDARAPCLEMRRYRPPRRRCRHRWPLDSAVAREEALSAAWGAAWGAVWAVVWGGEHGAAPAGAGWEQRTACDQVGCQQDLQLDWIIPFRVYRKVIEKQVVPAPIDTRHLLVEQPAAAPPVVRGRWKSQEVHVTSIGLAETSASDRPLKRRDRLVGGSSRGVWDPIPAAKRRLTERHFPARGGVPDKADRSCKRDLASLGSTGILTHVEAKQPREREGVRRVGCGGGCDAEE